MRRLSTRTSTTSAVVQPAAPAPPAVRSRPAQHLERTAEAMTPSGVTLARAVAAASASPSPPAASESGSTTLRVVYWTVWYIYQIGIALLAFFTITLPRTAFAILHWTGEMFRSAPWCTRVR